MFQILKDGDLNNIFQLGGLNNNSTKTTEINIDISFGIIDLINEVLENNKNILQENTIKELNYYIKKLKNLENNLKTIITKIKELLKNNENKILLNEYIKEYKILFIKSEKINKKLHNIFTLMLDY